MDEHIREFFRETSADLPTGKYKRVVSLSDSADICFEDLQKSSPNLNRGWVELAQLSSQDRVEFTREFWFSKLPYHRDMLGELEQFFSLVNEIKVFLVQKRNEHSFEPHLIYSLGQGKGFFYGRSPATDQAIDSLKQWFPDHSLPVDYLAFLQIHDGFAKATDTGILPSKEMSSSYVQFQNYLREEGPLVSKKRDEIDPTGLVPFYESFGMPVYQCFWSEWYPLNEMGNVYYSGLTHSISDIEQASSSVENLAFPTFLDWLLFYLEIIG